MILALALAFTVIKRKIVLLEYSLLGAIVVSMGVAALAVCQAIRSTLAVQTLVDLGATSSRRLTQRTKSAKHKLAGARSLVLRSLQSRKLSFLRGTDELAQPSSQSDHGQQPLSDRKEPRPRRLDGPIDLAQSSEGTGDLDADPLERRTSHSRRRSASHWGHSTAGSMSSAYSDSLIEMTGKPEKDPAWLRRDSAFRATRLTESSCEGPSGEQGPRDETPKPTEAGQLVTAAEDCSTEEVALPGDTCGPVAPSTVHHAVRAERTPHGPHEPHETSEDDVVLLSSSYDLAEDSFDSSRVTWTSPRVTVLGRDASNASSARNTKCSKAGDGRGTFSKEAELDARGEPSPSLSNIRATV